MAKFGKLKFGGTRDVHRQHNKGSQSALLPNRGALNDLTGGGKSPSMNDYAKASPEPASGPSMMDLGMGSPGLNDDY